jgi:hypothetical protein
MRWLVPAGVVTAAVTIGVLSGRATAQVPMPTLMTPWPTAMTAVPTAPRAMTPMPTAAMATPVPTAQAFLGDTRLNARWRSESGDREFRVRGGNSRTDYEILPLSEGAKGRFPGTRWSLQPATDGGLRGTWRGSSDPLSLQVRFVAEDRIHVRYEAPGEDGKIDTFEFDCVAIR